MEIGNIAAPGRALAQLRALCATAQQGSTHDATNAVDYAVLLKSRKAYRVGGRAVAHMHMAAHCSCPSHVLGLAVCSAAHSCLSGDLQDLKKEYYKGEISIEESAARVGLKLPERK